MGRCLTVTEVTASPIRGPAGVVPASVQRGSGRRPKSAALTCCPVVTHAVPTAEAVVRLAPPCRASSTPSVPCGPPSERASWGGRSHPTRRGRRAGHPKMVSGESCRTPLMDDSKIAPLSTSAARVHSQCSIVPDRTGFLPKQAHSCSVQLSRGRAVGGMSHDFIEHLRPEPAKARVLFRPCRFSRLRRLAPRAQCRSVAPCSQLWGPPGFQLLLGTHRSSPSCLLRSQSRRRGLSADRTVRSSECPRRIPGRCKQRRSSHRGPGRLPLPEDEEELPVAAETALEPRPKTGTTVAHTTTASTPRPKTPGPKT